MAFSLVNAMGVVGRSGAFCLAWMLLAGCSTTAPSGGGLCKDSNLDWALGVPLDEATYARLWRESGAGIANPVAPSTVPKRDARQDRLRIYTNKENLITSVKCE